MEHSEIVKAVKVELKRMERLKFYTPEDVVQRIMAKHPDADRKRVTSIVEHTLKTLWGGWSQEEVEQQMAYRMEQVLRHAETLEDDDERDAYLEAEIVKLEVEVEQDHKRIDALKELAKDLPSKEGAE